MLVKMIRLNKWGNSHGLRIGNDVLAELEIKDTEMEFRLEVIKNQIILTPNKKYPQTLDEVFADYEVEPIREEDKYDWGESVGRELIE